VKVFEVFCLPGVIPAGMLAKKVKIHRIFLRRYVQAMPVIRDAMK
jgi:hypothetical protein